MARGLEKSGKTLKIFISTEAKPVKALAHQLAKRLHFKRDQSYSRYRSVLCWVPTPALLGCWCSSNGIGLSDTVLKRSPGV